MPLFARSGFRSKNLFTDIVLGAGSGLNMSLWCYVYAALIFTGALSAFLPVGILSILMGWILIGAWVALTSDDPLHIALPDDQGIVIFGSIAALMVSTMGERATTSSGLATILCIIALTTLAFSVCCYLAGRYKFSQILELLPYPIICGFMASIGWLLLDAGFQVMAGISLSFSVLSDISASGHELPLALSALAGATLLLLAYKIDRPWALPAASTALVVGYYLFMMSIGMQHVQQQDDGWLFKIDASGGGALGMLAALSPGDIDWGFVADAIPQMTTILLLALLYASMTLTALKSDSPYNLSIANEFKKIGSGNLLCFAVCSPPGYTEVVTTNLYREFGASSRWMPLAICAVGLVVVIFGTTIIEYLPKLLIGASIFMFAFQMLYEWLYKYVRDFSLLDLLVVASIFATAITFGFMIGIGIGMLLTTFLFVMHYSRISAIHATTTLSQHRSSVERAPDDNEWLESHGEQVVIYRLRGFLFFGTANGILDTIQHQENLEKGSCKAVLLDLGRVTGIDISALMIFGQINKVCERQGALLAYSKVPPDIREKLLSMHAVSELEEVPLIFEEADYAMEYLENLLLSQSGSKPAISIRDYLMDAIGDSAKVDRLLQVMDVRACKAQETLFRQGDADDGLYLVESGAFSAFILADNQSLARIRKFKPGSLIGELSAYLKNKRRTATIVADVDSVVYHLNLETLEKSDHELAAAVHEMVAATLAERVRFMNERLSGSV